MAAYNNVGQRIRLKLLGEWKDYKKFGRLISISGSEAISHPFNYQLQLVTPNKDIMQQVFCNKVISCAIEHYVRDKLQSTRILSGVISEVSLSKISHTQDSPELQFEYTLTVKPKFSNLGLAKHSRVFYSEKQSTVDVIESVLKENKVDYELNVQKSKIFQAETYIQYNETDFGFVTRLINSAGLFYFFKHKENKHTMVISNQPSAYMDLASKDVQFSEDRSFLGVHNIAFHFSTYTPEFSVKAFSYSKPENVIEKKHTGSVHDVQQKPSMQSEEVSYLCKIKDTSQVTQLAENFSVREQNLSQQVTGSSNYSEFIVGAKFTLKGDYFNSITPKDYTIIRLDFTATEYIDGRQQYNNNFVAIPKDRYVVPNQTIKKPVIPGLHFALVVNSEGKSTSEVPYCDEEGRVFIKLLWGQKVNMCKANILSTSNSFSLPRIGTLVYVVFPYSNLGNETPVIIGIHNKGLLHFPKKEEWYKNVYMTYPASSDENLYNYISFIDKKEEQEIKVLARKDMVFDVSHDELISIKNDSTKTIKEGNMLVKVEKGKITIQSEDEIQIETKKDLNIKAGGAINMKAGKDINIGSSKNLNMKASSGANLQSGGDLTIKAQRNLTGKAGLGATYQAGTSTILKANTQLSIDGTMTEVKGKANIKISAPLTKIGM